jgi:hypothetical protein
MADPNPLAGMPLAESLANQMNESLQWMSRMWGNPAAPLAGAESMFGGQSPLPPGLPSMLMPTLDPKELEKRINDLKTVAHWLDMNRALLQSTIQTLEMQRNAIVALQAMARPAQAGTSVGGGQAGASAAAETAAQSRTQAPDTQPLPFDPTTWWNALQEQFARVAAAAAAATQAESPSAEPQPQREAGSGRPASTAERARAQPEAKSGRKPSV